MAAAVDQAIDQLDLDITTLRALITELRPATLDQLGLEPALLALVDRTRRAGMEVVAEVVLGYDSGDASARLAAELETGAYRIVQEALTKPASTARRRARPCRWPSRTASSASPSATTGVALTRPLPPAGSVWPACASASSSWVASCR